MASARKLWIICVAVPVQVPPVQIIPKLSGFVRGQVLGVLRHGAFEQLITHRDKCTQVVVEVSRVSVVSGCAIAIRGYASQSR